jgi:signal transduction histidine kinase
LTIDTKNTNMSIHAKTLDIFCRGFNVTALILCEKTGILHFVSNEAALLGFCKGHHVKSGLDETCKKVMDTCLDTVKKKGFFVRKLNLMQDDEPVTFEAKFKKEDDGLIYVLLEREKDVGVFSENVQEKLSALMRLSNGIAHNLRSPLMTLKNIADFMSMVVRKWQSAYDKTHVDCPFHSEQEQIGELLGQMRDDIASNVSVMSDLIGSLRVYGKTDRLNEYQMTNVISLIQNAAKMVEYNAKAEIQIKFNFCCDCINVFCIPSDLQVVFMNLLENASEQIYDSKQEKGIIEIAVTEITNTLQIRIRDNGGGIPVELLELNELFEPFATRKVGGTGLGLHSCFKIIKEHRGNICARNHQAKIGQGADFLIVLPTGNQKHDKC